jgi:hypothetical protein
MALPGRFARRQIIDYSQPQQRDRAALKLQGGLGTLTPPPLPDPLPEPPAAPLSYLTDLFDLVSQAEALNQDQQRDILDRLEHALRSFDQEERRGGHDILVRLSSRDDLYAAVDRTISQLRSVSDQASPELNKTLRVPDVDGGSTSDWLPTSGWMPTVVDDFWVNLLAPIRDQVLVPFVGPNLALVNVGDAEQTFDTLIGQNLVDRYHLTVPPGMTTMGEAVAAFLRERGHDHLERLYRVINDIMMDLDPAPGDALRNLAAIDDLRLFVNTTPDRLLAEAVNQVRFQGEPKTRELSFSPNKSAANSHEMRSRLRQPIPSFSICLVEPTPRRNMRSTQRTDWSGYTRWSATPRAFPTGWPIR